MRNAARLIALACLFGVVACTPPAPRKPLETKDVRQQVKALAGVAGEADLFAQQVAERRVNRPFVWVHQQALSEEAGKAAQALARPAPEQVRATQQRAIGIAAQLQQSLNQVAQTPPEALAPLRERFAQLRAEAQGMGKAL